MEKTISGLYSWKNEVKTKNIMQSIVANSWFFESIRELLEVEKSATLEDLIVKLGSDAGAEPKQHVKNSLKILIEYLKFAGLVKEEDGEYFLTETKDVTEKPSGEKIERETSVQPDQIDISDTMPKVTPNILLGIIVTPGINEEDLRKTVRIVLDEIKRWSEKSEEKRY